MPISYHPGADLFSSDAQAWVNTVNCVGVMGKGIALEFSNAFHENFFLPYKKACRQGRLTPGRPFIMRNPGLCGPEFIVNATTKDHWKDPSRMEWVEANLQGIQTFCQEMNIASIAIPRMGCGNGGLLWSKANPLYEAILTTPATDFRIYAEREIP